MRMLQTLLIAMAIVTVMPPAHSAQRVLPATDYTTITDEGGQARLLVTFGTVRDIGSEWISSATLHVPLTGRTKGDLGVVIDVPRTSWSSGSAAWGTPWIKGGGDPYEEQGVEAILRASGKTSSLSVDVTHLVRAMQAGEVSENGFLIYPSDPGRAGFSAADAGVLDIAKGAVLEVSYRPISARYRASLSEVLERKAIAE